MVPVYRRRSVVHFLSVKDTGDLFLAKWSEVDLDITTVTSLDGYLEDEAVD